MLKFYREEMFCTECEGKTFELLGVGFTEYHITYDLECMKCQKKRIWYELRYPTMYKVGEVLEKVMGLELGEDFK